MRCAFAGGAKLRPDNIEQFNPARKQQGLAEGDYSQAALAADALKKDDQMAGARKIGPIEEKK